MADDDLIADDPDYSPTETTKCGTYTPAPPALPEIDTADLSHRIFDHVVEEFNKALPSFLQESVDPTRQKEALYNSLSQDLKDALSDMETQQNQRIEQQWRSEREKMQADLKQLSEQAKDIENKRNDIKQKQLSAERQRRALSDRVHDLEKTVLALEAEKEQLDLETKSLVNKVKVSQVHEKDNEALREQVNALQAEINQLRLGAVSPETSPAPIEVPEPLVTEEELNRLHKVEEEYNALNAQLGQINEQMNRVENITKANEEKISTLTSENQRLAQELATANEVIAQRDSQLEAVKKKINETSKERPAKKPYESTTPSESVVSEPITLDDDLLNDTEWIVNAKPSKQKNPNERAQNHRGHRRNNTPDDDRQMSLW